MVVRLFVGIVVCHVDCFFFVDIVILWLSLAVVRVVRFAFVLSQERVRKGCYR